MVLEALSLTHSECRLARSLVHGRCVEEAAREANVTTSTARSYLKRIFSKTGVRRESEFAALGTQITPPISFEQIGRAVLVPDPRS